MRNAVSLFKYCKKTTDDFGNNKSEQPPGVMQLIEAAPFINVGIPVSSALSDDQICVYYDESVFFVVFFSAPCDHHPPLISLFLP